MAISLLDSLISPSGFAYDSRQHIFFSRTDAWQRNFGYFAIYDMATPFAFMNLDCEPIRFTFNRKKWNIEFWKGQYGPFFAGAEVGVYTGRFKLPIPSIDHRVARLIRGDTACALRTDWLKMSFILKRRGRVLFTRNSDNPATHDVETHWWLTGFKKTSDARLSDLVNEITIVFNKPRMIDAFEQGLKDSNYQAGINYVRNDNLQNIVVIFDRPLGRPLVNLSSRIGIPSPQQIWDYFIKAFGAAVNFTAEQVGDFIMGAYGLAKEAVANTLSFFGYAVDKVGEFLNKAFSVTYKKLIKLLKEAGYTANEVGKFINDTFSVTYAELVKGLKSAGYSTREVGIFLRDILGRSAAEIMTIFSNANYTYTQVLNFVRSAFNLSLAEVGRLWAGI